MTKIKTIPDLLEQAHLNILQARAEAATLAFRRWCWYRSSAIFIPGKRTAQLAILAELPCFYT